MHKFTDHKPTPEATLKNAFEIGVQAGLKYIYIGNVFGWGNDTFCHNCRKLLIKREGFAVLEDNIKACLTGRQAGKCPFCDTEIPGRFN